MRENEELKQKMVCIHQKVIGDTYPILPVDVPLDGKKISEPFGHHMSVCVFAYTLNDFFVALTIYKENSINQKSQLLLLK